MKIRKIIAISLTSLIKLSYANESESVILMLNNNDNYIQTYNYWQNPWHDLTKSQVNSPSDLEDLTQQNIMQRLFNNGIWNLWTAVSAQYTGAGAGFPSYGYGTSLFAQTGQIGGFSAGGMFELINPIAANNLNGSNKNSAPFLPAKQQITPSEAFLEYQYNHIVQVDAGLIAINNSPWLSQNYYDNMLTAGATYQGLAINIAPGNGWLLSVIGFNAAQGISETGFTGLTWYNKGYDYAGGLINNNNTNETSNGTIAIGANYSAWDNLYNLRMWGYNFANYGQLLYADTSLKLPINQIINFTLAAQGGTNNNFTNSNTALNNAGYGGINSNFLGIQGGFNYDWMGLNVAYNNIWGSGFGSGAIVSPFTFGMATDPLYTTPYMAGLVDLATAGSAYKISPNLNFLSGNLTISPAFTSFSTANSQSNGTKEYDLTVSYNITQIKGLTLFVAYAYQQVPQANPNNSSYVSQFFASYLY
ncbi:MAG: hypothetical protein RLZZ293_478 [Pseudomonadota bacterium]